MLRFTSLFLIIAFLLLSALSLGIMAAGGHSSYCLSSLLSQSNCPNSVNFISSVAHHISGWQSLFLFVFNTLALLLAFVFFFFKFLNPHNLIGFKTAPITVEDYSENKLLYWLTLNFRNYHSSK